MHDLREAYLQACRAYATEPTEEHHRRLLELARKQQALEREHLELPRVEPELEQRMEQRKRTPPDKTSGQLAPRC